MAVVRAVAAEEQQQQPQLQRAQRSSSGPWRPRVARAGRRAGGNGEHGVHGAAAKEAMCVEYARAAVAASGKPSLAPHLRASAALRRLRRTDFYGDPGELIQEAKRVTKVPSANSGGSSSSSKAGKLFEEAEMTLEDASLTGAGAEELLLLERGRVPKEGCACRCCPGTRSSSQKS